MEGAGITLGGDPSGVKQTLLQGNLARGGGIALSGKNLNVIEDNTSIENGGCDINDRGTGGNTWTNNRFATKCCAATD